ncbi:hypothetical protein M5E87_22525 [Flavonifractor plautii]|nr:hypothetical protein M5E87_22525 [Flavonifractor plautii]
MFAPLRNLGLLILDEEQESTYKSENVPKYHARDVAKYRCAQNDALLVLGSATPSVESMYHARRGDYRLFTLRRRYNEQAMPEVLIADMKQELRAITAPPSAGPSGPGWPPPWRRGSRVFSSSTAGGPAAWSPAASAARCPRAPAAPST